MVHYLRSTFYFFTYDTKAASQTELIHERALLALPSPSRGRGGGILAGIFLWQNFRCKLALTL